MAHSSCWIVQFVVIAAALIFRPALAATIIAVDVFTSGGAPHVSIAVELQPRQMLSPEDAAQLDPDLDDELKIDIKGDADTQLSKALFLQVRRRSQLQLDFADFAIRDWLDLPAVPGVSPNTLCAINEIASRGGILCAANFTHNDCTAAIDSACCRDPLSSSSTRQRPLGHYCLFANCSDQLRFFELDSSSARTPYIHNFTIGVGIGEQRPCTTFNVVVDSQATVTRVATSACNVSVSGFAEVMSVQPTSTLTGVALSFVLVHRVGIEAGPPLILFHREELAASANSPVALHRKASDRSKIDEGIWCSRPLGSSPAAFLQPSELRPAEPLNCTNEAGIQRPRGITHSQFDALFGDATSLNERWGAYPRGRNFTNYVATSSPPAEDIELVFNLDNRRISSGKLRDESAATRLTFVMQLPVK